MTGLFLEVEYEGLVGGFVIVLSPLWLTVIEEVVPRRTLLLVPMIDAQEGECT